MLTEFNDQFEAIDEEGRADKVRLKFWGFAVLTWQA